MSIGLMISMTSFATSSLRTNRDLLAGRGQRGGPGCDWNRRARYPVARTTSDLFVASRAISPWWNAAAISGEYLSAASFLGVTGLEMQNGLSALWLPVGDAAGYLALLLFVAAPLRRLGAYTISDFAGARLAARRFAGPPRRSSCSSRVST